MWRRDLSYRCRKLGRRLWPGLPDIYSGAGRPELVHYQCCSERGGSSVPMRGPHRGDSLESALQFHRGGATRDVWHCPIRRRATAEKPQGILWQLDLRATIRRSRCQGAKSTSPPPKTFLFLRTAPQVAQDCELRGERPAIPMQTFKVARGVDCNNLNEEEKLK